MMTFKLCMDQMGRGVEMPEFPKRIVSLVPSLTELLVDLGLEEQLVGVTKFCVHPNTVRKEKAVVGGTKNFRFEVIDELKPDLIIGNKEENYKEGIEKLARRYPVWMSDIFDWHDALEMIDMLGEVTGKSKQAKLLIHGIKEAFDVTIPVKGTAVYLIWQNPVMVAGKSTFIDEMLSKAGFQNLVNENRYPEMTLEHLRRLNPEYVLLSSEPFPFQEKHLKAYRDAIPNARVILVDGEMFSWYGSRLRYAMDYFRSV